jgi:PAS domain-containing protein
MRSLVHIELSLSAGDAPPDLVPPLRVLAPPHVLGRWLEAVAHADDCCLVLDADGIVLGVSPACVELFGAASADEFLGRGLLDDVLDIVDFTAARERLGDAQLERLPPLLALSSESLARGLLRIRTSAGVRTLDAVSTPLRVKGELAGSLTFVHRV